MTADEGDGVGVARRRFLATVPAAVSLAAAAGGTATAQEGTPTGTADGSTGTATGEGSESGAWPLPRGDASNTGLADGVGPVASARRRWRTELDAEPVGPPAAVGGSAYVADDGGTVTALRAADGTVRWQVEVADGALGQPAVHDGAVFVGGDGRLVALSTADGSERWAVETEVDDPVPVTVGDGTVYAGGAALTAHAPADGSERWRYGPEGGVSQPPAVADGRVYVATFDAVVALDARDRGRVVWRVERREPSAPAVGAHVYVGGETGLAALDPADGSEAWSYDPGGYARVPTVGPDHVHAAVSGGDGPLAALAPSSGEPAWETELPVSGPAALVEATLLVPGPGLAAVSAGDGTRRFAYEDPEEPSRSFTAPAVAGGLAFVGDDADGVQAVESPRSGARFDIDRLATGLERARERGLELDGVASELRAARDAFDAGNYDTAGRRARAGWDVLAAAREQADAARRRIDRLDERLAGMEDASAAREKLQAARDAYERGDYAAANETAAEGLELVAATRQRRATATSRIDELATLVEEGPFGANAVPTRFLERARAARDRGAYGNATALAERGIAAAEARTTIRGVRDAEVLPVVEPVSDLLGRSRKLRQARAAYQQGNYRAARDHADAARWDSIAAFWITLLVLPVGLVGGGLAAYGGLRVLYHGLTLLPLLVIAVVERVVGGVRGAVGRATGAASGAANAATETATAPVQARRERKREAAEEAIAAADEAVGDPSRGGFAVPGEWTDRRVQCPECSQFAKTDGGEVDPPRADCSNCEWVGDRAWLVEHDHYDPTAGDAPVRPSVAGLREARRHLAEEAYGEARGAAETAERAAEAEADALAAIEAAEAKVEEDVPGAPTDEAADELADARAALADGDYDRALKLAESAELTAAAPVDRLVEEARERATEAAAAVEDGEYGTAIAAYETTLDRYDTARERAAATGDDEAVADIESARETVRANLTAARLARFDDRLADAREDLTAADGADDAEAAAEAETAFAEVLGDLEALDPVGHDGEYEDLLTRARRGVVEAKVAQGRAEMAEAEALFEAESYGDARERFEAVADRFEETLATADDYGLDETRAEIDALVETCRTNASEARRALYDVGSVDPELSSVDEVDTGLDLGVVDDGRDGAAGAGRADDADRAGGETRAAAGNGGDVGGAGRGSGAGGSYSGTDSTGSSGSAAPSSDALASAGGTLPDHERLEHLGTGGTAAVHRVALTDGSEAALKVPRGEDGATLSGQVVEAFVTEAETWAKLDDHPGVVEVYDWGTAPYPWLLLEYLPGGSLAARLPLAPGPATDALAAVCEAVNHAHTRGVAHADLKPANVLFTADDRAKVGDWGLANVLLEGVAVDEGLTPAYAAPEQLRDGEVDTATDVYQLGVVAYETLTGRNPFAHDGADSATVTERVLDGEFDPPTAVDGSLPDRADEVVARAMAAEPADRHESVLYLRDALEGVV